MKHALFALPILFVLAGCADQERDRAYDMRFASETASEGPSRKAALPVWRRRSAACMPSGDGKLPEGDAAREQVLRNERLVYARGLEKILLSNGMRASVLVYEGRATPTPMLIFVGRFARAFVHRALTEGAVLERARELGFRSVEFFDRGPDHHYQFVLSKTGPLPRCAAYNRLCL